MLGMIEIGFQGSRLGRLLEWGKGDGATQVIWAAIYAESRHPLFVFSYQVRGMNGASWFPCVITWSISLLLDQELELLVFAKVPVAVD